MHENRSNATHCGLYSPVHEHQCTLDFRRDFRVADLGRATKWQTHHVVHNVLRELGHNPTVDVSFSDLEMLSGEQAEKLVSRLSELSTLIVSKA